MAAFAGSNSGSERLRAMAVAEHARFLGIREPEFFYIAEEALTAQLPHGWSSHEDSTNGIPYYYHAPSDTTTWDNPVSGRVLERSELRRPKVFDAPARNSSTSPHFSTPPNQI